MDVVIEDVDFSFDEGKVLHKISIVIDEPGLVCIIGPNGVGKSTLIRCINKLLKPTSGKVVLGGKDIEELKYKDLSKFMGYVPVASNDFFPMTVMETVLMGRHPYQKWSYSEEDLKVVYDTMEVMSIQHLAIRNFGELSAGQHQRAMIARGLAQRPDILILDEPTSNLDVRHQLVVIERLRDLAIENKFTIIMVSHDLNIASKYADKVIIMATPGIVYKVGTAEEVLTAETIRYVYGVDCQIIDIMGRPHVVLLKALPEEEIRKMHADEEQGTSR
ncbi:MAG: ABC transporter ATP-binding protein [Methanomassiliicoccaceae archaeon]|nr:ABC transporter ATP-binding protein [Methanomassiliicoccaceae archaeon]